MKIKKQTRKENIMLEMRQTPKQLASPDLGSPKKVWNLLCEKDDVPRNSNIFLKHPKLDSKMRAVLLEWLMEVCHDRRLHRETFHLCIDYIDKYLEKSKNILSHQLQLLGSTALVIATKMEEIYPPKIHEISDFTDGTCSEMDIRSMEENMLQVLEWNCTPVTSIHWLGLYLQLLCSTEVVSQDSYISKQNILRRRNSPKQILQVSPCSSNSSLSHSSNSQKKTDGTIRTSFDSSGSDFANENENDFRDAPDMSLNTTEMLEMSYIGYQSYSDGHIYPDQRCTVPKLVRDEFVRLAMILDIIMLDVESLKYKYSEISAAIIWCCYEPESLVQEVTGFHREYLSDVIDFVEPFVLFSENLEPAGICIPSFSEVLSEDSHNIQTFIPNILSHLEVISSRKNEALKKHCASLYKSRKRKLREMNGN